MKKNTNPAPMVNFMLEHKVSSKYHNEGEMQEISVEEITLGRDEDCQVRFDESFMTVSRHHAKIIKEEGQWKLVQFSQKNSTFLNGQPIHTDWYLQDGDEIQLALNGPKLIFRIPSAENNQEASKPIKKWMTVLSIAVSILILGAIGFGVSIHNKKQEWEARKVEIEQKRHLADSIASLTMRRLDTLKLHNQNIQQDLDYERSKSKVSRKRISELENTLEENVLQMNQGLEGINATINTLTNICDSLSRAGASDEEMSALQKQIDELRQQLIEKTRDLRIEEPYNTNTKRGKR